MTFRRKKLNCCDCDKPAFPRTRVENGKAIWEHGADMLCPHCFSELRILVRDDFEEDQWAQVTSARLAAESTDVEMIALWAPPDIVRQWAVQERNRRIRSLQDKCDAEPPK